MWIGQDYGNSCAGTGTTCNIRHQFYPSGWKSTAQALPWSSALGSASSFLAIYANQYVGYVTGLWHGFLCVDLTDAYNQMLELCGETWYTPGQTQVNDQGPQGVGCGYYPPATAGGPERYGAEAWVPLGEFSTYLSNVGAADQPGTLQTGYQAGWTSSWSQFSSLVSDASTKCNGTGGLHGDQVFGNDQNPNDWNIDYTQDGFETLSPNSTGNTVGPSELGAVTWNEVLATWCSGGGGICQ